MKYIKLKDLLSEIIKHGVDTHVGMNIMKNISQEKLIYSMDYFTEEYIKTALWTEEESLNTPPEREEPDEDDDDNDVEGDEWNIKPQREPEKPHEKKDFTIKDISAQTLEKIISDCKSFYDKYSELYHSAGWSDDRAAHDFWLTRNGHGAGFWSREMNELDPELYGNMSEDQFEEVREILSKGAKKYGTINLYLGDDGLIYGG